MYFTRFGITLDRLELKDVEKVREWRNSPWVRPYMRYRDSIDPDQQIKWFEGLDAKCDWYFKARNEHKSFALFHIKGINWKTKSGEAGGFVGDASFIGRAEPAQATLALMDFGFRILQLACLQARYKSTLTRLVRFNQQLGYEVDGEEEDFLIAHVTPERYFAYAAPLRKAAMSLHGNRSVLASPDPWLERHVDGFSGKWSADFELQLA